MRKKNKNFDFCSVCQMDMFLAVWLLSSRVPGYHFIQRVAHLLACQEESFPILVAAGVTGEDQLYCRPSVDKAVENFLSVDTPHKSKCERVRVHRGQAKKKLTNGAP